MSIQEVQSKTKLISIKNYQYRATTLPDGHPDFEEYRFLITPIHGLCKLDAWTPVIKTNSFGSALKASFEQFFEALTAKYGEAKRYDFLIKDSIWKESKYWMTALQKEDRVLAAFWSRDSLELPNQINGISIQAYAVDAESGMLSVVYEFDNHAECFKWIKDQKDAKL